MANDLIFCSVFQASNTVSRPRIGHGLYFDAGKGFKVELDAFKPVSQVEPIVKVYHEKFLHVRAPPSFKLGKLFESENEHPFSTSFFGAL